MTSKGASGFGSANTCLSGIWAHPSLNLSHCQQPRPRHVGFICGLPRLPQERTVHASRPPLHGQYLFLPCYFYLDAG